MKFKHFKHPVILLCICLASPCLIIAQNPSITIEECHQWARANYPTIKKLDLVTKTAAFDIENANKRFLPQLTFSGQASYQSQTISFPDALAAMPGAAFPNISKDQYKIQADISQLLYDGGNTKNQKEMVKASADLQTQNIEASLYSINQRINNVYFSILLMEQQLRQNELNKASLQTQVDKTESALVNGTAFRSNLNELKAEILNIDMVSTEYQSNKSAYLKILSLLTGKEFSQETRLTVPEAESLSTAINRPELKVFALQKAVYDTQEKQLKSEYLPQVNAFFQGAYGRPTLNIVDNQFGSWYFVGLKFSWSLGSLYTMANRKNIIHMNRQSVEADQQTFLLNTDIDLSQQNEQIEKYNALIKQDMEVIALRDAVTKSAQAQLENGVITIHEYIQKINTAHLAKQTKILHEIQLLQAQYNQKYITGN